MIGQFFPGENDNSSEVQLKRMLRILEEFPQDQILSLYVIDDVWDYMKAIKVFRRMSVTVVASPFDQYIFCLTVFFSVD